MLKLENINFTYGEKTIVLDNFNLEVVEGEIVAIQGKSGVGKSTILRLIAGLEQVDSGTISLNNTVINAIPANKRDIGFVFQNHALFPHMTIAKNIAYGLHRLSKAEQQKLVEEIAIKVDIKELLERYPHEISGGQKQRVAIARSLITKPKILLLDEPFTALDQELKDQIRSDIYHILQKFNITTILVTHDKEDAIQLHARIVQLTK